MEPTKSPQDNPKDQDEAPSYYDKYGWVSHSYTPYEVTYTWDHKLGWVKESKMGQAKTEVMNLDEETKDSWIKALEELVEKNPEASSVILPKDYIVAFLKRNSGQRKAIFMYQKVVADALAYATKACDLPVTQWKPDNVMAAWEVIRKKLII